MFFLNLSLPEFLTIFTAVSGLVFALYLLDRSKRRQVVPTLRFWNSSDRPIESKHRRRLQQPWSLLLQLLSMALLLLTLAQLRWGAPATRSRDHVLLLDTSAWMGARSGAGILMDQARAAANAYIAALPASDRLMVVRTDALATPATVFESDRTVLGDAIQHSRPSSSALNIAQALAFAQQIQKLHARQSGEIVFVGAGRIPEYDAGLSRPGPPNLRVVPVTTAVENCGLRKIGLRRSEPDADLKPDQDSADLWEIFVAVKNYGRSPRTVSLALQFGGAPLGTRRITLAPGAEQNASFRCRTRAAGWLEARLLTSDAFPADDRAVLEVPAQGALKAVVYSDDPASLRPLLSATRHVDAVYRATSQYQESTDAQIAILDRFSPPRLPKIPSIWLQPPARHSPVAVREVVSNVKLTRWRSDHALGMGLRTKDLEFASTEVFLAAPDDIAVAEVDGGPVILARPAKPQQPKLAVIGFDAVRSNMKYELATPLLFANLLRWMAPEIFRVWEVNGGTVGVVNVALDPDTDPSAVKVATDSGNPLPYTIEGDSLRFFAGSPGTVRILSGNREMVYSLTLPEVADADWKVPPNARRGVPRSLGFEPVSRDLWQILAILGGLGLLTEWLLFGRSRRIRFGGTSQKQVRPLPAIKKAS